MADIGGLDALDELLRRRDETTKFEIDSSSLPPLFQTFCQSTWYFFLDDALDKARDTIDNEHY